NLPLRDKRHSASIGHDVVAGGDGHIADGNRLVGGHFNDAAAGGTRRVAAGKNREVEAAAVIDIADRAIDDHAGYTANLRADREIATPGGGVQTGALLDDNDVAGL